MITRPFRLTSLMRPQPPPRRGHARPVLATAVALLGRAMGAMRTVRVAAALAAAAVLLAAGAPRPAQARQTYESISASATSQPGYVRIAFAWRPSTATTEYRFVLRRGGASAAPNVAGSPYDGTALDDSPFADFTAAPGVTYYYRVYLYARPAGGALPYQLAGYSAEFTGVAAAAPSSGLQALACGQARTGVLAASSADSLALGAGHKADRYTLRLQAGESVTLALASPDFDGVVALLDASGQPLQVVDDTPGGGTDARLTAQPGGGQYLVEVTTYAPGAGGGYTLAACCGPGSASRLPVVVAGAPSNPDFPSGSDAFYAGAPPPRLFGELPEMPAGVTWQVWVDTGVYTEESGLSLVSSSGAPVGWAVTHVSGASGSPGQFQVVAPAASPSGRPCVVRYRTGASAVVGAHFSLACVIPGPSCPPGAPAGVAFDRAALPGGGIATGTVTLSGPALAGGQVVSLSSADPAVAVPATVFVPPGATSATFPAATSPVKGTRPAKVTATFRGQSAAGTLTVLAPGGT